MVLNTRTITDTGLSMSDSISRSVFTVPGAYQVAIHIPYVSGAFISAQLIALLQLITPAHIQVTVGYNNGFLVGISLVGIDSL